MAEEAEAVYQAVQCLPGDLCRLIAAYLPCPQQLPWGQNSLYLHDFIQERYTSVVLTLVPTYLGDVKVFVGIDDHDVYDQDFLAQWTEVGEDPDGFVEFSSEGVSLFFSESLERAEVMFEKEPRRRIHVGSISLRDMERVRAFARQALNQI